MARLNLEVSANLFTIEFKLIEAEVGVEVPLGLAICNLQLGLHTYDNLLHTQPAVAVVDHDLQIDIFADEETSFLNDDHELAGLDYERPSTPLEKQHFLMLLSYAEI